jgi:hypothetical protein
VKFKNLDEAVKHFTKMQAQVVKADTKLKALIAQYKQDQKDYFGLSDGESYNILQVIEIVRKLK